jgi:DNA modification methylase
MADYREFLAKKRVTALGRGMAEIPPLGKHLFGFQSDQVRFALKRGCAALFDECGLGKTPMQLEWARIVAANVGPVLILAPLAVAFQTVREGAKFGTPVVYAPEMPAVLPPITITNYERLAKFDARKFAGVVLDESSILKSYMGKIKRAIIEAFTFTPYKLACSATPAPNDHLELGNHAEFLGIMQSSEMISRWFINDTMKAGGYRLKRHAEKDFWRWVASWACCVSKPSDLGYSDEGFVLPALNWHEHVLDSADIPPADGELIANTTVNATTIHAVGRLTAQARALKVAELVAAQPDETWVVWCNTNYEADALTALLPDFAEVRGNDSPEDKARVLEAFAKGEIKRLLTKPSIAAQGVNWQHCANFACIGLSYSYEDLYQLLRRFWRFRQLRQVNAHVITTQAEAGALAAVKVKAAEHETMKAGMLEAVRTYQLENLRGEMTVQPVPEVREVLGRRSRLLYGDCCDAISRVSSDSVGFTVFSPPFSNLYIYSDSEADMGNCADDEEFFEHFRYLIPELLRVTIPGRLCAVHCKDLPLYQGRDGTAGLRDFPGEIIREFSLAGWTYHSRVTIWKDPVLERARTNNNGLLYCRLCDDSTYSRQGMADYLLVFRKWNEAIEFPAPVRRQFPSKNKDVTERFGDYIGTRPPDGGIVIDEAYWRNPGEPLSDLFRKWSIEVWQRYASPVWFDIRQTNVLNIAMAKADKDEKHICPLQLDVIARAIELWSNPNDLVASPFGGIGSEPYQAVKMGRRALAMELKESYFAEMQRNVAAAEASFTAPSLLDGVVA